MRDAWKTCVVMRRYIVNAAQMSLAVTLGFLLAPVVVSLNHMVAHLYKH